MKKIKLLTSLTALATVGTTCGVLTSCNSNKGRDITIDESASSDVTIKTETTSDGDLKVTITTKDSSKAISSVTVKIGTKTLSTSEYTFDKSTGVLTITKAVLDKYQGAITITPVIEDEPQVEWETAFDDVNIVGNPNANYTMTVGEPTSTKNDEDPIYKFGNRKGYSKNGDEYTYYANPEGYDTWLELTQITGTENYEYTGMGDAGLVIWIVYGTMTSTDHTWNSSKSCFTGTIDMGEGITFNYEAYFVDNKIDHIICPDTAFGSFVITFSDVGSTTIDKYPSTIVQNIKSATKVSDTQYTVTFDECIEERSYLAVFSNFSTNQNTISLTNQPAGEYTVSYEQSDSIIASDAPATTISHTFTKGQLSSAPLICIIHVTDLEQENANAGFTVTLDLQ